MKRFLLIYDFAYGQNPDGSCLTTVFSEDQIKDKGLFYPEAWANVENLVVAQSVRMEDLHMVTAVRIQ